jgi:hypothetical protein
MGATTPAQLNSVPTQLRFSSCWSNRVTTLASAIGRHGRTRKAATNGWTVAKTNSYSPSLLPKRHSLKVTSVCCGVVLKDSGTTLMRTVPQDILSKKIVSTWRWFNHSKSNGSCDPHNLIRSLPYSKAAAISASLQRHLNTGEPPPPLITSLRRSPNAFAGVLASLRALGLSL